MSKIEKLLAKVKNNPKSVRFEEIDKLLLRYGFRKRQSSKGTSHFNYDKGESRVTIPFKTPHIKQVYIESAIEAIENSDLEGDE